MFGGVKWKNRSSQRGSLGDFHDGILGGGYVGLKKNSWDSSRF